MFVNASALHVLAKSRVGAGLGLWEAAGASVWLTGFLYEVIGDAQLQQHRDDPSTAGTLMTSGLWRHTRHPNYFGEALSWWGIYLIACGSQGGHRTIYSALFITFLIRFISGVPMLEDKQKMKAEFRLYMMETNVFSPMAYRPVPAE